MMINIFNRKELTATYSTEKESEIRETLSKSNIDYTVKVVNRTSPSPISSGTRGRSGSFGIETENTYQYIFYVHKKDYDKSISVLGI